MRIFKKIICLLLCLLFIIGLVGCTARNENEKQQYKIAELSEEFLPSGTVAQNGSYSLHWDSERIALFMKNGDDIVWSSLPIEQYHDPKDGGVRMTLESHLIVEYENVNTKMLETEYSYYAANENGRVYSRAIKDGISITYCFDSCYISVTVDYRLCDGYLDISVNNQKVYEDGSKIYKISLMPYAVSATNNTSGSFLIPDGSGMIMKCNDNRGERTYSGKVYGTDDAITSNYSFTKNEAVRLPVFGIINPDENSSCCIIDEGEGSAEIKASVGNSDIGYSNAFVSFYLRGSETIQLTQKWGTVSLSNQYSERINNGTFGIRIYPLSSSAEYSDIASVYREYLIDEKGLANSKKENLLYLDIPMAATKREFYFGYPVDETKVITSYSDALSISEKIKKTNNISPVVRLLGVQNGGIDITKIAGGFKLEKALGKKDEFEKLLNSTTVYTDFDIVRFRKSSSGFRINTDSAVFATSLKAYQYFKDISTQTVEPNTERYLLLTPMKLYCAAEKLLNLAKKLGISNISLSTAGRMNYSDYRHEESYASRYNPEAVNKINGLYGKSGMSLMYDNANQYAAVAADHIVNTPTVSSKYLCEDDWYPFYQMVFKGYTAMSTSSLNLSDCPYKDILFAAQTGIGIKYTVTGRDVGAEYLSSPFDDLSAGDYNRVSDDISETIQKLMKVHSATKGASLTVFERLYPDVYRSLFSNGVSVIVNYGTENVEIAGKILHGGEFQFTAADGR